MGNGEKAEGKIGKIETDKRKRRRRRRGDRESECENDRSLHTHAHLPSSRFHVFVLSVETTLFWIFVSLFRVRQREHK